jgi:hypothetical protein
VDFNFISFSRCLKGPLLCKGRVYGVHSTGTRCDKGKKDIYNYFASVSNALGFIYKYIPELKPKTKEDYYDDSEEEDDGVTPEFNPQRGRKGG